MKHLSERVSVLEKQVYNCGSVLYIADKPWIERVDGISIHLSLCLRRCYNKGDGFVTLYTRSDRQVKRLALDWAERFINQK